MYLNKSSKKIISKVENSGTSILNTDSDMYKFNFFNQTVPEEYVNKVKEIGFEKNQIFLFVKTHNSLHSVGHEEYKWTNNDEKKY